MKHTFLTISACLVGFILAFPPITSGVELPPEEVYAGHKLIDDWNTEAAEHFTNTLLKKYPKSGDAYFLKARVEFLKGNHELATKILKQVTGNHSEVHEFKNLVYETYEETKLFATSESKHFIYRYQKGSDEILVHYATKVLEKSYKILGKIFDYYPKEKVLVEFYPNRESFSKISPLTLDDIAISGTVALCKYNRIMMISPGSLVRGYNWMDTLSHEYTHYILTKKSRNNLPLWMHEGIAKYFETRWRNNYAYLTPIMETMLAGGLQKNYLISLDDMMPSLAKLKTAEDVQLAYAEVSTMIEYLTQIHGDEVISTLLEKLAKEESFDLAMSDTIGINLDIFQRKWKNFVKQKKLKTIPGLKPPGVHFKADRLSGEPNKEYREIDDRKSRDLTFLGDILQSRNFYKAALIEYQRAIDQSKVFSPILHNKLAKAHLITKEYNKAEVILNRSLNYYPMFQSTLATMGELYFDTGDTKRSRDFYERAIQINPFNPFVHMRLMTIYQKLEWKKEKELQTKLFGYIDH